MNARLVSRAYFEVNLDEMQDMTKIKMIFADKVRADSDAMRRR